MSPQKAQDPQSEVPKTFLVKPADDKPAEGKRRRLRGGRVTLKNTDDGTIWNTHGITLQESRPQPKKK